VTKLKRVVDGFQNPGVRARRSDQEPDVPLKEYEMARDIRDGMEARYDLEKTKLIMPSNRTVVHQLAEQIGSPATRGREFFVTLGTVCSLPFSIGLGILLMYAAEMIIPRRG